MNVCGDDQRKNSDKDVQELSDVEKEAILGESFLGTGYFVNTVGIDEDMIRRYVKYQEKEERRDERDQSEFKQSELGL